MFNNHYLYKISSRVLIVSSLIFTSLLISSCSKESTVHTNSTSKNSEDTATKESANTNKAKSLLNLEYTQNKKNIAEQLDQISENRDYTKTDESGNFTFDNLPENKKASKDKNLSVKPKVDWDDTYNPDLSGVEVIIKKDLDK